MDKIVESGMVFGPYQEEDFFYIEKSEMLKKCPGVSTVEFIVHPRKSLLYFIEAKSSAPVDSSMYTREIARKFIDSFHLFMAGLLKRKTHSEEIGENIRNLDYQKVQFRFFLILSNHREEWLPPLKAEIEDNLKGFQKIWNSEVVVLNDYIAREEGLIS